MNNGTSRPFEGDEVEDSKIRVCDSWCDFSVGDLDGTGTPDLVLGLPGEVNQLLLNNGSESPFDGVMGLSIGSEALFIDAMAVEDVDGDGDLDLMIANRENPTHLYLNNGTPVPFEGVSGRIVIQDSLNVWDFALGDVDGDGNLDLVVADGNGGANRLYLNNGTTYAFSDVRGLYVTREPGPSDDLVLGDVDNDGKLDLIVGGEEEARIYLNQD